MIQSTLRIPAHVYITLFIRGRRLMINRIVNVRGRDEERLCHTAFTLTSTESSSFPFILCAAVAVAAEEPGLQGSAQQGREAGQTGSITQDEWEGTGTYRSRICSSYSLEPHENSLTSHYFTWPFTVAVLSSLETNLLSGTAAFPIIFLFLLFYQHCIRN